MRICPRCRRHAFATEPACPFCGGPLPLSDGPRGIGVALGLALVSCGGGSSGTGDDGAATTSAGGSAPGSTLAASSADATDDGTTAGSGIDEGDDEDDCGGCCAGFYGGCPPDGGALTFECDLITQDCPDGEKCVPWANDGGPAWNATRCTPLAAEPVPIGGTCVAESSAVSGIDDCDIGLMCWDVDENNVGHCEDFCTGSIDAPVCENPAEVCYTNNDGAIALCLPGCDPVLQDCATSEACWPDGVDWVCLPDVSGRGPLPGTPCASDFDCSAGLLCVLADLVADCAGEIGCCAAVCDVTASDPNEVCTGTDPPATCEAWYGDAEAPPGLAHVGVCVAGEDDTTGG